MTGAGARWLMWGTASHNPVQAVGVMVTRLMSRRLCVVCPRSVVRPLHWIKVTLAMVRGALVVRERRKKSPLTCANAFGGVLLPTHLDHRDVYLAGTLRPKIKHPLTFGMLHHVAAFRRSVSR